MSALVIEKDNVQTERFSKNVRNSSLATVVNGFDAENFENEYLIDLAESRMGEETVPIEDIFKKYNYKYE